MLSLRRRLLLRPHASRGTRQTFSGACFRALLEEEVSHGHAFLFVPVLVGAGAASWFAFPSDPPAALIFGLWLALCLIGIVSYRRVGRVPTMALASILFLLGGVLAQVETWRAATVILDGPVTTNLMGKVQRREAAGEGRWRYFLEVVGTANPALKRPPERVVLLVRSKHEPFAAGEKIAGRARLSPPSGPALPRLNDFAFSTYFDRVGAVGFFYGAPARTEISMEERLSARETWASRLESAIFALRGQIAERIRAVVPGDAGAFAAAIVTDERRAISKETTEALRVSGLAHIVAISGLNMALAAGIFFVGLRTCLGLLTGVAQAWPIKKIAAFGALLMATAYYLISGFAVSAERAYLMMSVMLVAVFFDRAAISLRNVAISAIIIIAVSPSEVMGPSFQMSFAATIALVAGYSAWSQWVSREEPEPAVLIKGRLAPMKAGWNFMAGIFVTSLIGGVSTAIYSMDHFHRLPGYGLAANLAVMPIISFLVMPAGLIGMLLMPFGLEAPFLKLMGGGLDAVIAVAKHVATWGGEVGVGRQHTWFLVVSSAGFLLLCLLRTRLRLIGLPLLAFAFFLSSQEQRKLPPDVLVSEDATLVVLLGSSPSSNRAKPASFIFDQWQRAHRLGVPLPPQISSAGEVPLPPTDLRQEIDGPQMAVMREAMMRDLHLAGKRVGRFHCRKKLWCTAATEQGVNVVTIEDWRVTGLGCDLAHLVVAPRAHFHECRSGALLLSGDGLRKTGALEIRFRGSTGASGWKAEAATWGVRRPWTEHRLYDWRSDEFSPAIPAPVSHLINGSAG